MKLNRGDSEQKNGRESLYNANPMEFPSLRSGGQMCYVLRGAH